MNGITPAKPLYYRGYLHREYVRETYLRGCVKCIRLPVLTKLYALRVYRKGSTFTITNGAKI